VPIFDNHIHLRPEFKGVQAAREFERAGGTSFLLTHSPYADIPIARAEDYERAYAKTLAMADAVRRFGGLDRSRRRRSDSHRLAWPARGGGRLDRGCGPCHGLGRRGRPEARIGSQWVLLPRRRLSPYPTFRTVEYPL